MAGKVHSIQLKPLTEINIPEIVTLLNHPQIRALMPLATESDDAASAKAWVEAKERCRMEYPCGPCAIVIDDRFAGWGGLQPENQEPDLALVLLPEFWGMGRAVFRVLLDQIAGHPEISAVTVHFPVIRQNQQAIEKLGFVRESTVVLDSQSFVRYRLILAERSHQNALPLVDRMNAVANPAKAAGMQRFFKCGPGQYGAGDRFLGIPNPTVRALVKQYRDTAPAEALSLLQSPWHEVRLAGLLLLVHRYAKGDAAMRETIYHAYLAHTQHINNWDLVDLSAPGIVGEHLLHQERGKLYELAASPLLWDQRIAMISTLTFIRHGDFTDTLKLAKFFLSHKHDLMHKATGWMLREVGKRDRATLTAFLNEHKDAMPRTALRYAIEHYTPEERRAFLQQKNRTQSGDFCR